MTEPRPLNPKQLRFIDEYLVDCNGTQAVIRAGYATRGADVQATRLLADARIAAELVRRGIERSAKTGLEIDAVLQELAVLSFSDVRNFRLGSDGELALREGVPDDAWRAVASVEYKIRKIGELETERTIRFKLWDKNAALEKAMKYLGLLKEGAHLHLHKHQSTTYIWKVGGREVAFK